MSVQNKFIKSKGNSSGQSGELTVLQQARLVFCSLSFFIDLIQLVTWQDVCHDEKKTDCQQAFSNAVVMLSALWDK